MNSLKSFFMLCIAAIANTLVVAQYNVELGVNFNYPNGAENSEFSYGSGMYVAPTYSITENWEVIVSFEAMYFEYGSAVEVFSERTSVLALAPALSYRLKASNFTPFARIGVGIYDVNRGTKRYTAPGPFVFSSKEQRVSDIGLRSTVGICFDRCTLDVAYHWTSELTFIRFNFGIRIFEQSKPLFKQASS